MKGWRISRALRRDPSPAGEEGARLGNLPLRGQPASVDEDLGDLHRVERRPFAQIVRYAPQADAVVDGRIVANARDIGRILAGRLVRRDIAASLAPVDDQASRRLAQ